ncbi:recombinase family protein [uncultured Desulfovibrio sp.]|uniref:Recombinase family protein n=1 Tax=Candidatus Desulfovibrio intestinavium TaxID=2838534 RepID=A0A9D2HNL7_9BACT|nr:recombinase family protein [uncultured Desulfovibrio sp.]HJA79462.1 recombinase family protein [Candidatus Desulfovibrio intestinavium]
MDIGYVRVSSCGQHTERQLEGVRLDKVFLDTVSGRDTNRPELQECLAELRQGDTLHVHSIDRLTRNLRDLLHLLEDMADRGVTVRFHKERLIFTNDASPFQRLHLQIIGAVAEFERAFIRERQREGIAIARTKGKYKGRKPRLTTEQIRDICRRKRMKEPVARIARTFGMSRQSIYRILKQSPEGRASPAHQLPSEDEKNI